LTPVIRISTLLIVCLCQALGLLSAHAGAQSPGSSHADLQFVVYLSRHGVRSPTALPAQYNRYSAAPWPGWDVPPGYLTAHGFEVMKLFGAYDRATLASQGLLPAGGCEGADRVAIYADSEQRTRETGKALAEGLYPGCTILVESRPDGTADPLFHPLGAGVGTEDSALAAAAITGRIGGDPDNLTTAYHSQLAALDTLLSTCGAHPGALNSRTSLFDIPAVLSTRKDHPVELHGPLNTASSLSENLLLEYTQGMDASNVGWGCVDGAKLRALLELHSAAEDIADRTPAVAHNLASILLDHVLLSLQQAATGKPIPGALGKPSGRVLFLVGHDTNLAAVAGLLNLNWIADGRRDDTPPGGALVFELWRTRETESYFVRTYFTTQTLEQMRFASQLSAQNPPQRVPVFVPACSNQDFSCSLSSFAATIQQAIGTHRPSAK
jgi:4-phytase/acid phosphatase